MGETPAGLPQNVWYTTLLHILHSDACDVGRGARQVSFVGRLYFSEGPLYRCFAVEYYSLGFMT